MNGLDWLIIAVVAVSVILAAAQGFFFELFSLAGTVAGYLLAAWQYQRAAAWFLPYVKSEWIAQSTAFLVIFLAVVIFAGIVGRITRWAVQGVGLRWFDRFLGAAFGLVRGALIVMVIVMALASFGPGSRALASSTLGPYFLVLGRAAVWASPYELREKFRDGLEGLRELQTGSHQGTTNAPKSREGGVPAEKK